MRVLITGVSGFLGGYLVELCAEQQHSVAGIDRVAPVASTRDALHAFVEAALSSEALDELVQQFRPDVCLHCAGRASVPDSMTDPVGDFQAGTLPTLWVLDSLRRLAPACRFVLVSSAAVYGDPESLPIGETQRARPLSPYGFHKLASEQLCREYHELFGLRTASVRVFSAYGEGLRRQVVWDICQQVGGGGELALRGSGEASRDFVHARDVARAIMLVADKGHLDATLYNVASGIETTIATLADQVCAAFEVSPRVHFDGRAQAGIPLRWRANIDKLAALGFSPTVSLADGIRRTVRWWHDDPARSMATRVVTRARHD